MRNRTLLLAAALAMLGTAATAQIDLNRFWSQGARDGRQVPTFVDTVLVETEVGAGLATTTVTMVLRPGAWINCYTKRVSSGGPDGKAVYEVVCDDQHYPVDSIEMTTSFTLPTDFVASNLWLWVEGEPVEADIQDRTLANQQYREIVGQRRDPALLQYNGYGYYNLRIFPARSDDARRIAIEWRHTFDDDSASLMTLPIPLAYDSTGVYYYQDAEHWKAPLGRIEARFTSTDNRSYSVEIPGLGSASFGPGNPAKLAKSDVWSLGVGTVTAADPSGADAELMWVGRGADETTMNVGFATALSESELWFEPVPDTRVIVLDIRNESWDWNEFYQRRSEAMGQDYQSYSGYETIDIWERAQKYAIMCLQAYAAGGHKFNVVLPGAEPEALFEQPVAGTIDNLEDAYRAILGAGPSKQCMTSAALQTAVGQAGKGVVILISDLYEPADYWTLDADGRYVPGAGAEPYEEEQAAIRKKLLASDVTAFSVDDNWQMYRAVAQTGGFRLASLYSRYGVEYEYVIVDGKRVKVAKLPDLFGSRNPAGIRGVKVEAPGIDSLVFTTDGYAYYGYYNPRFFGDGGDMMVRKASGSSRLVLPGYSSETLLRVAGRTTIDDYSGSYPVTVTGKMAGLRFRKTLTIESDYRATVSSYRPAIDKQWPFRNTEHLAATDLMANALAIKAIGKEHHIVTRQTSLLALEPGMELWEDTVGMGSQGGGEAGSAPTAMIADASGRAVSPSASYGSGSSGGVSADDISMEELLQGVPVVHEVAAKARAGIEATVRAGRIAIRVPSRMLGKGVTARLYDLSGRLVAKRRVGTAEFAGGVFNWRVAGSLARGTYALRIDAGTKSARIKVTLP